MLNKLRKSSTFANHRTFSHGINPHTKKKSPPYLYLTKVSSEKMNILTKIRLINELNEKEMRQHVAPENSWHQQYKVRVDRAWILRFLLLFNPGTDSAWVYAGNLAYTLTEGDLITVFSQWGEISNINLVRDKDTGKSKGFCFICYEDQRSTILAVDNFNGMEARGWK